MNREPGNLPAEVTSFVGRREATAGVKRLLSSSRLVTLTGVGGTGKSRLALHVAREMQRTFSDGVRLVELATLSDPSLVGDAVAAALGLSDRSNRDPQTVLVSYLADKRLLLVLDNCEHLLGECALLVARLLSAAPGLRVLATSREPLGIAGEHVWPVSPLSVPRLDASSYGERWGRQYEALALFEERAAAVLPGFTLNRDNVTSVARLCQRLDGLPLAIELAAVRLRAFAVNDILARLEDRFRLLTKSHRGVPERHQTLRAAIESSFELCTQLERTVWARLSVFAGEFDLAAAEEVCAGEDVPVEEVFTGVAGLLEKSLLARVKGVTVARYRMLETIRQYGRELLGDEKELVFRRRHRDYYLRLCEQAEADWFGPRQVRWLDQFQAEQPNLWAALEFCLTQPEQARTGLRMAGALYWYWIPRAIRDGRRWLDRALAGDTEPSPERAKALWAVGWVADFQGDLDYALSVLNESADLARRLDDQTTLGHALQLIGLTRLFHGEAPASAQAYEQALVHHRSTGVMDSLTALALSRLGLIVGTLGDTERAVALCAKSIAICQARGEQFAHSWGLWHLAFTRWLQDDLPQVNTTVRESLRLASAFNGQFLIAWCVEMLAWVSSRSGDAQRAVVLFGIGDTMWARMGRWLSGWQAACDLSNKCKAEARETLGQRAFDAAFQLGKHFTSDEALAYALSEEETTPSATPTTALEKAQLTRREREVATLVAKGMSNKDIAATLVVAQRTAESHVEHILSKLGFTTRTQIAAWLTEQQDS